MNKVEPPGRPDGPTRSARRHTFNRRREGKRRLPMLTASTAFGFSSLCGASASSLRAAATDTIVADADTIVAAAAAPEIVVEWEPASPADGSALGVTIAVSGSSDGAVEVAAEFDGRPIHVGRLGTAWFGLVALPTERIGPMDLTVSVARPGAPPDTRRWTVPVRPRSYSETELSVEPRFTSPPPEVMERIERERELVRATLQRVTPEWLIDGNFVRPRNTRVTSPFGQKRVFNGELQSRHWGVDLAGEVGDPVRVAGRGRVAIARNLYYAGNAVYVDHGLGVFSGYYHLSEIDVEEGQMVERGQLIGRVGATGRVTGPHLHWSFFAGGERLDATSVLEIPVPAAPAAPATEAASDPGYRR